MKNKYGTVNVVDGDDSDYAPLYVTGYSVPFKFPMSLVRELIENCDAGEIIKILGEDVAFGEFDIETIKSSLHSYDVQAINKNRLDS